MTILITGGAGFIGSSLALELSGKGHEVIVLDSLTEQVHGKIPAETSPLYRKVVDSDIQVTQGDVCDPDDLRKGLKEADVVVHLAAETGTGQSMYQIAKYEKANIGGTALLLDLLVNTEHSVQRVVIASSRAIYGEGKYYADELGNVYPSHRNEADLRNGEFEVKHEGSNQPLKLRPTDEESKIHPSSIYGITKQVQEQMVECACSSVGIDWVSLRYQNVYGQGQSLSNPYTGIISIFSTLVKNGNPINVFEDGKESRDFVYIDDVVDATVLAIEEEEAKNEIFNVGSGVPTSVLTVAEELVDKLGVDAEINITGNFRIGDIRHNYADLSKIKNKLGFTPRVSFAEGISKFVDWVNELEVPASDYDKSIGELAEIGLFK